MFTPRVTYEADLIPLKTSRRFYIGLSDAPLTERYNNHKRDFRNRSYENYETYENYQRYETNLLVSSIE